MWNSSRNSIISVLVLLLISLGTCFFRLGGLPFMGPDEPRYARIAEEMEQTGRWVTPILEGQPWLEKPPLYYWLTIPVFRVVGVSEASARFGPAVLAFLACLAIFWAGSKLWSRTAGFLAAAILLTCLGYIAYARSASTDMPITACLTMGLALLMVGAVDAYLPVWTAWIGYIFIGLATLAKGPVALVLAAGIGLTFWCFDDRGLKIHWGKHVPGLVALSLVSLPWFWLAFRENGFAFVSIFVINHNLARYVSDIHHHTEPVYYYVPVLAGLVFPWSGWLPVLIPSSPLKFLRGWRRWNSAVLFLVCWILFPFLFFSFSYSKLPGYMLPVLPPTALLLGVRLSRVLEDKSVLRRNRALAWFHLVQASAVAIAVPFFFFKGYGGNWKPGIWAALCLVAPLIPAFYFILKRRWRPAIALTLLQGVLMTVGASQFAFSLIGQYNSAKGIALQVLSHRRENEPAVAYRLFNHGLEYYTRYQVGDEVQEKESLERFAKEHRQILVVTEVERIREISEMPGLFVTPLATQGKLILLRLAKSGA